MFVKAEKLALGTVQFGLPYGVANTSGQVGAAMAASILKCAKEQGVDTLDTAIAYGESEHCLGGVGVSGWSIVSKIPALPIDCKDVAVWVHEQIQGSLSRLKVSHLSAVLLHQPDDLLGKNGESFWSALKSLKRNHIVNKIGFSIYDPASLDALWHSFQPDIVQAPLNIFDQRLIKSGWLQRMYESEVEVHARSIFLQGLLLMNHEDRPKIFERWSAVWTVWDVWLSEQGITPLQACLAFILNEPMIGKAVIGVDSLNQLNDILNTTEVTLADIPQKFSSIDYELVNPSLWSTL